MTPGRVLEPDKVIAVGVTTSPRGGGGGVRQVKKTPQARVAPALSSVRRENTDFLRFQVRQKTLCEFGHLETNRKGQRLDCMYSAWSPGLKLVLEKYK